MLNNKRKIKPAEEENHSFCFPPAVPTLPPGAVTTRVEENIAVWRRASRVHRVSCFLYLRLVLADNFSLVSTSLSCFGHRVGSRENAAVEKVTAKTLSVSADLLTAWRNWTISDWMRGWGWGGVVVRSGGGVGGVGCWDGGSCEGNSQTPSTGLRHPSNIGGRCRKAMLGVSATVRL